MEKEKKIALTDLAKKARNQYMREYRRKNRDKIRQHTATYWERMALRATSNKIQ